MRGFMMLAGVCLCLPCLGLEAQGWYQPGGVFRSEVRSGYGAEASPTPQAPAESGYYSPDAQAWEPSREQDAAQPAPRRISPGAEPRPLNPDGYFLIPSLGLGGSLGFGSQVLQGDLSIPVYGVVGGNPAYLGPGDVEYTRTRQDQVEGNIGFGLPLATWLTLEASLDDGSVGFNLTENAFYQHSQFASTTRVDAIGFGSWDVGAKIYPAALLGMRTGAWGRVGGPLGPYWVPSFRVGYFQDSSLDQISYTAPDASATYTTWDKRPELGAVLPLPGNAAFFIDGNTSLGSGTSYSQGATSVNTSSQDSQPRLGAGFSLQCGSWDKVAEPDFGFDANPDGWLGIFRLSYAHWEGWQNSGPLWAEEDFSASIPCAPWLTLGAQYSHTHYLVNPNTPGTIFSAENDDIDTVSAWMDFYPGVFFR